MNTGAKNIKEAVFIVKQEMQHITSSEERSIALLLFKAMAALSGIIGFLTAIFKFDRSIKDAILYSVHSALYIPALIAAGGIVLFSVLLFNTIKEGAYNQLSDKWVKNHLKTNIGPHEFEAPHYRFMIPSILLAIILALTSISLIPAIFFIQSAFLPDGMESIFLAFQDNA
ncbi:hypothetical protein LH431_14595 [Laribacter hongkongensis]|uniref:hypothetical protein n=1 Tax=Laribacter hongkongensis TaxID=168471 RepID=UPI001EFCABA6|nr:hypothetical protein [Laribacter hongkongensis]MCG9011799.1 hypothetical protein [Laribacter hongkongensis]